MRAKLAWSAALVVTALGIAGAVRFGASHPPERPQDAWVKIVRIGLHETRWRHDAVVTFETSDGLVGETLVRYPALSCRVGDTAAAVKQGISIRLKPPGCAGRSLQER